MLTRRIPVEPEGSPTIGELETGDEPHRAAVAEALGAWIDACAGDNARTGVQVVQRVRELVDGLMTAEQRRVLLIALGDGMSLADVGAELDVSRWAVGKRWPDLIDQARPLRWLSTNQQTWREALEDLLAQEESRVDQLVETHRQALVDLREAVDAHRGQDEQWWLLVGTPDLARILVGHLPPDEFAHHVAHDWIHALIGDYDRTRTSDKPKPRIEVTRAAVQAATQQRLGRAG